MKPAKIALSFFLLVCNHTIFAQEATRPKHEIGVPIFAWERNRETANEELSPKWMPGIFYNRHLKVLIWTNSITIGKNKINDVSNACGDCYYGEGDLREFVAATGLRFHFFQGRKFFVKPFLELGIYYSHIRYIADLDGGLSGDGAKFDFVTKTRGYAGRVGLTIRPTPRLTITAASSYRDGKGKAENKLNGGTSKSWSYAGTPLQLSVGVLLH